MTTITILKQQGLYVYDDYYRAKAILRIRELNDTNPVQKIYRSRTSIHAEAILVNPYWYNLKSPASPLPIEIETVSDDYLSVNLSSMVNILLGRPETTAQTRMIVDEGPSQTQFKVYALIQTKEFFHDGSTVVPYEDTPPVKTGGNILAYLISPDLYIAIA